MSTGVRGLTTRGGIGENAFLRAGGGVAQLGEHHVRNVGVEGSIPFSSTTFLLNAHSTWLGASSCLVPLRLSRYLARTEGCFCHPPIFFDAVNGGTSGSTVDTEKKISAKFFPAHFLVVPSSVAPKRVLINNSYRQAHLSQDSRHLKPQEATQGIGGNERAKREPY